MFSTYFRLICFLATSLVLCFLQQYSIRTRGRAIEIFVTITTLVAHTGAYEKGFIEQYLQPIIPMFCEKFVECLRVPNGQTSDCGFKTDIIKAINCLVTKLPKYISDLLPQMLPPIWETLCQSAKTYQEMTVNADEDVNDKEVDSDGMLFESNNKYNIFFLTYVRSSR